MAHTHAHERIFNSCEPTVEPDGSALAPVEDAGGTPVAVDDALCQEHEAPAPAPLEGDHTAVGPELPSS